MKKFLSLLLISSVLFLSGCSDADIASQNLSKADDYFEIDRRIVFYNGITGEYIITIEGKCSLGNYDQHGKFSITCKTGPNEYKKHFLGLSDNVTYFVEQLNSKSVSAYHYKVMFKPQTIIPDVDLKINTQELTN